MTATAKEKHQTDALHGPNLILDVENFGPIAEAKNVEIKPMTVFVGPSNTGKSYLAVLLHAFLQAANSEDEPVGFSGFLRSLRHNSGFVPSYLSLKRDIIDWAIDSEFSDSDDRPYLARVPLKGFSAETREFITSVISAAIDRIEQRADHEIIDYFDLVHDTKSEREHLTYSSATKISLQSERYRLDLTDPKSTQRPVLPDSSLWVPQHYMDMWSIEDDASASELTSREINNIDRILARYIYSQFAVLPHSFYVPTGRTGIMNAQRVLTSQIVRHAHRFGIEEQDNINYHRLARDFLTLLIDLGDRQDETDDRRSSHFGSVADLIARSLIHGEINVAVPEFGLPDFEYARDGVVTPMFRASSMVTELAPIILVLRHYVHRGNVLIIDEPEAHLHPEAQQQMAAALAFMVRSGLRVLITTHSHYLVEQLSAFVNASKLDEATRKRALSLNGALGKEDIYLNEDETAVYSFAISQERGGSVVEEIFMGEEYEYGPDDHSDATTDQFNRLQRVLEAREAAELDGLD